MRAGLLGTGVLALSMMGAIGAGGAPPDKEQDVVTKQDYERLRAEMDAMKQEMDAIKKDRAAQAAEIEAMKKDRVRPQDLDQAIEEIEKDAKKRSDLLGDLHAGDTKLLLTGYAFAGYNNRHHDTNTFDAGFNPIFVWQLSDRILFQGEVELTFNSDGGTDVSLEQADISYIFNDWLTVGAGRFLLPFGIFNERLHPAWINKLPDRPLPFEDEVGIAPEFDIGAYARGGLPLGSTRLNYAVYVLNGPTLITDPADGNVGSLNFEKTTDQNHNKAVGGRVGFLPIPELEAGYSVQYAKVSPSGFESVYALLQDVDVSYKRDIDALAGTVDLRAEWVWSNVETASFATKVDHELRFSNDRNGGYLQAAYRPSDVNFKPLRNFEFIVRYDMLSVPNKAPGVTDERRWTLGLDYWISPYMVIKTAYEFDHRRNEEGQDAFLIQTAVGF
jgi:hypothetical protein